MFEQKIDDVSTEETGSSRDENTAACGDFRDEPIQGALVSPNLSLFDMIDGDGLRLDVRVPSMRP